MRKRIEYKRISVSKEVHERLLEDRDHFQEVIGGGTWSISDTITEYFKILNTLIRTSGNKRMDADDELQGKSKMAI